MSEIVSTAHEAMARAYALAKDYVSARTHIKKARTLLNKLSLDDEDREMYLRQLEETEALIRS